MVKPPLVIGGRCGVGNYYSNYDRVCDWLMMPGRVEGRPAMLAFDPEDSTSGPAYFILLEFTDDELHFIRDFRYASYVMADAEWERFGRAGVQRLHCTGCLDRPTRYIRFQRWIRIQDH